MCFLLRTPEKKFLKTLLLFFRRTLAPVQKRTRDIEKMGARKFRKCEKSKDLNQNVPPSAIFCPKSGKEQKKSSSLKFGPIFRPKSGEEKKKRSSFTFFRFFAHALERVCPRKGCLWPRIFFCVLGLEPCALNSTSVPSLFRLNVERPTPGNTIDGE